MTVYLDSLQSRKTFDDHISNINYVGCIPWYFKNQFAKTAYECNILFKKKSYLIINYQFAASIQVIVEHNLKRLDSLQIRNEKELFDL